jgi:hypothetical protein
MPGKVRERFLVDEVTLKQVFLQGLRLPYQYHSIRLLKPIITFTLLLSETQAGEDWVCQN